MGQQVYRSAPICWVCPPFIHCGCCSCPTYLVVQQLLLASSLWPHPLTFLHPSSIHHLPVHPSIIHPSLCSRSLSSMEDSSVPSMTETHTLPPTWVPPVTLPPKGVNLLNTLTTCLLPCHRLPIHSPRSRTCPTPSWDTGDPLLEASGFLPLSDPVCSSASICQLSE